MEGFSGMFGHYKYKNLTKNFCENSYLKHNPDVEIAVKTGKVGSGLEHYLRFGSRENRHCECVCASNESNNLYEFGGLYHDFKVFGFKNEVLPGIYELNQKSKEPVISAYIQYAIAKTKVNTKSQVSFAELFAADCYYAMLACHFGATKSIGIDNNISEFSAHATPIAKALGIENFEFILADVNNIDQLEKVDIVANLGGLYHVSNPREIIEKSFHMASKFLIIQTVVSMTNDDEDYFESPAPGWTWGSRFSKSSFDKLIKELNYDIVDQHFNELEGNDRLEDKGSVYYLIRK